MALQKLPPDWSSGVDASGRIYYVNLKTKQTQWEAPGAPSAPPPYSLDNVDRASDERPSTNSVPFATAVTAPDAQAVVQTSAVVQQPPHAPPTVVMYEQTQPGNPPPGAPPGGHWVQEKYCGIITWLVGIFVFWCVCCCPCDDRTVYIVDGRRYNKYGAIIQPGCC